MTDREFWQFTLDVSEAGGYFRSDNFLSNETGFQYVIPELLRTTRAGGVYLGVGPEQNFTYVAALKPKMAIIFDIRRGNVLEHLLYKAIFELSSDRADFLSRLFSRARPAGLDSTVTPDSLFRAYVAAAERPLDSARYRQNVAAVRNILVNRHGFALSDDDIGGIRYVYEAFFNGGALLNYRFGSSFNNNGGFNASFGRNGGMPTYADLMAQNDGQGVERSFLANEANFRWVKDLEARNMLIPVVGDFAGAKAIRAVGKYLRDHGATVTAFYASNVEQYLFQQSDDWNKYYANVATLPLDSSSTFIRSIGRGFRSPPGTTVPPITYTAPAPAGPYMRLPTVLCSMNGLLEAFRAGKIQGYYDVIQLSH
ncbi:MAG TPA: hypothetical protein VGI83_05850 [Gemmatimonadales bacterium]|jgi:hypothetical protein